MPTAWWSGAACICVLAARSRTSTCSGARIEGDVQLYGADFGGEFDLTGAAIGGEIHLSFRSDRQSPTWQKGSYLFLRNANADALQARAVSWNLLGGDGLLPTDLIGFTFNRLGGLGTSGGMVWTPPSL